MLPQSIPHARWSRMPGDRSQPRCQGPQHPEACRSGHSVLELMVAATVLTVLVGMTAAALGRIHNFRQKIARRTVATETLANVMERVSTLPYDALNHDRLDAMAQAMPLPASLPQGEVEIEVAEIAADNPVTLPSRRITATVAWQENAQGPPNRVRCVVFRFPVAAIHSVSQSP